MTQSNSTRLNYIGVNGIVTQDLNSITEELESDFKGIYGDNINLESNTADGQWLNILAQQKIDALDFQTQLYNNLDVDSVIGLPQQVLYKLNGLTIKAYTYSFVYVDVTTTITVTLNGLDANIANVDGTGYTVTDTNGNNWILAESITLATAGTYTLLFRAQELGQITALANTINTMSTIVAGVSGVVNSANNFITGQTGESASEFRTRRNRSMQAPSQGFKESIEGQLLALNDVSDCKVYDSNDDENIDGVQVIVQGGTGQEIGNIIYNNLPPGINTEGAYETIITVNERDKVLNYDKPNPISILVKGTIESLTGNTNDIDLDYVKQTLASKVFNIGELAESATVTTEIKNIVGELGSPYDIQLSLGVSGGAWTTPVRIDDNTFNSIIYDGTTYVAAGRNGKVATSTDLTTWTTQTITNSNINLVSIAFGDGKYAVVGSNKILVSTDLSTWNEVTNPEYVRDYDCIKYLNNNFVISYHNYPNDYSGVVTTTDFTNYNYLYNITYDHFQIRYRFVDFIYDNTNYVIAGTQSNILDNTSYGIILEITESGGIVNNYSELNQSYFCIGYYDSTYIVGGTSGLIKTSTNLTTWTNSNVGTNSWYGITKMDGLYVLVGTNGYIVSSEDLTTWTTQKTGNNEWKSVINANSKFIAIGYSLSTYTLLSADWTEVLTPTGLADFFVMTVNGMEDLEVTA